MNLNITAACLAAVIISTSLAPGQSGTSIPGAPAPFTIPGLKRSESEHADIYAHNEQARACAESLINDVAREFKNMTGAKTPRGIVIVTIPKSRHPLALAMDLLEAADSNTSHQIPQDISKTPASLKTNALPMGLKPDDLLQMAPVILPPAYTQILSMNSQTNRNPGNTLIDPATIINSTNQATGDSAYAWTLCLPSTQSTIYVTEEILPRLMRAELGLAKYILIKPFMGKIKKIFAEKLTDTARIELFNTWLGCEKGLPEDKKEKLKQEYAGKFAIYEK